MNITEEECACEAVLSFEDATYNGQALQLVFRYGDQTFAPDSANEMKKIIYRKTSGEIGFFRRNITVEEQAVQLLTNAGLQQLNATHFQLSAKAPEKTIVEWINNHREMLQQSFHLTSNVGNALYCLDEIRIEQSCDDEVDWFELHITVVIGNLRIPFSRFRKHILEEKREYLLPDGRMILLPEEWFSKYANLLEMGVQTEKGIRLKHAFIGAVQTALGEDGVKNSPRSSKYITLPYQERLKQRYAPISRKDSRGWYTSINKDLADAWQMTWDSGRRFRLLPCYSTYISHPLPNNPLP